MLFLQPEILHSCKNVKSLSMVEKQRKRYAVYKENVRRQAQKG